MSSNAGPTDYNGTSHGVSREQENPAGASRRDEAGKGRWCERHENRLDETQRDGGRTRGGKGIKGKGSARSPGFRIRGGGDSFRAGRGGNLTSDPFSGFDGWDVPRASSERWQDRSVRTERQRWGRGRTETSDKSMPCSSTSVGQPRKESAPAAGEAQTADTTERKASPPRPSLMVGNLAQCHDAFAKLERRVAALLSAPKAEEAPYPGAPRPEAVSWRELVYPFRSLRETLTSLHQVSLFALQGGRTSRLVHLAAQSPREVRLLLQVHLLEVKPSFFPLATERRLTRDSAPQFMRWRQM